MSADAGLWVPFGIALRLIVGWWGYVGLLALVAVALFRRFTSRHDGSPPVAGRNPRPEPVTDASEAVSAEPADTARDDPALPADGTVGGLP